MEIDAQPLFGRPANNETQPLDVFWGLKGKEMMEIMKEMNQLEIANIIMSVKKRTAYIMSIRNVSPSEARKLEDFLTVVNCAIHLVQKRQLKESK